MRVSWSPGFDGPGGSQVPGPVIGAVARALARTWRPGDEVLVTRLDHDANITPWVLAARDAGVTVRHVEMHPEDCPPTESGLRPTPRPAAG